MPELPEVETTRRGIAPHCQGHTVRRVIVRERRLRWPVPADLEARLQGRRVDGVGRRAKYLLLSVGDGTLMIHLGMSGSLRLVDAEEAPAVHDHIDIQLDTGACLRFNDPRRFGSFHWLEPGAPVPLLDHLGPEPLSPAFDGDYLYRLSRGRKGPVKNFIMDGKVVVGVGNIYASEALFIAGIRPDRAAGRVSKARYESLVNAIKLVLTSAIEQGGTTLRDFVGGDGKPGYFAQQLRVYGRSGEPCRACGKILQEKRISQRSSVYCMVCQR